ncbi:MAG: aminodeoxychorismate/anthranilate synthase component II [Flavobacteriales bacterium]|nr:aminodeoxychorismate/anthranilate synthase component II [Flavobacteriales bacterium]
MQKILVIDNFDSFTYNLVHYIEAHPDCEIRVVRNNEISLEEVGEYDTLVLSPGPGLPDDAGMTKAVIQRYAPVKKILGVCLGMQAIGEVFGAELKNLQTVYHGVATPLKVLDATNELYKDLPGQFEIGRYHSWVLASGRVPSCLEITAVDAENNPMSLKHKDYRVYGVQYHPESVLTENGRKIISNFLEIN